MNRRQFLPHLSPLVSALPSQAAAERPNVILILADDLGYGDLGSYGQRVIQTPNLDRMAAEGMRFRQFYAGSTVCAPSRCVLMTGQHLGHCHVRGNAIGPSMLAQSLRESDVTLPKVLQRAGYATALIGKWGLGEADEPGHPLRQGFDYFFGFLNQVHAHNYWPEFLWNDHEKLRLENVVEPASKEYGGFRSGWATVRKQYAPDLFLDRALSWVEAHKQQPFFLYFASTLPHANNESANEKGNGAEIPDHGIYSKEAWPDQDKGQAAMVTRLDRDVGRLLDQLRRLGLDRNTLVLFTSDNGPHMESGNNPLRFNPAGPLRGMKRHLYEGGIRVPLLAWWPSRIAAGSVTDHVGYSGDLMATACELAQVSAPPQLDSISMLPLLTGRPGQQREHEYLYWEFYEGGSAQAIRWGKWKAIRKPMLRGQIELYDVSMDPGEKYNVARGYRDVVRQAGELMDRAHVPHANWRVPPQGRNL